MDNFIITKTKEKNKMQNPIQRKTKAINGLQYTAYICGNEIQGITFKSPKFIGK